MEPDTLAAAQTIDFSLLALFLRATLTVKIVMVLLILASVWSWAIIIEKSIRYRRVRREDDTFEDAFWSGQPLEDLFDRLGAKPRTAIERIFSAGMSEWRRSYRKGVLLPGSQRRIERSMDVTIAREGEGINRGLGVLATVGSISPFVGLFGTVWGIKNAFEDIAMQQSTNLAVVAPGIAEALVATALGLVAAIPAVIFYNKLSGDADHITANYENFADEFSTILSRQIERSAE
ncbi:protein TolQ [Paroceanicella profunda]|uniref:Tol-Pal system protein TolQ n=2 Tax=Paroceanicella profunda TaxID=2579971 RepID=A0A5B8FHD4_9RHOB|nr:protein TolQ [Paroceanicella profunda]